MECPATRSNHGPSVACGAAAPGLTSALGSLACCCRHRDASLNVAGMRPLAVKRGASLRAQAPAGLDAPWSHCTFDSA